MEIAKKLSCPGGYACLLMIRPEILLDCCAYAGNLRRGLHQLTPEELQFHVVDINGTRLFCAVFDMKKIKGVIGFWQHPGPGTSTRLAETLLPHVESLREVPLPQILKVDSLPEATYLPEGTFHGEIRTRIASLLDRGPALATPSDVALAKTNPDDIYLYSSGMAALYDIHRIMTTVHHKKSVCFGSVFPSTIEIVKEYGAGFEIFGAGDETALGELTTWLEAGNQVQTVFVEFPSNPILCSAPLMGLRALADEYNFILVVDDTVGSFCNVDVRAVADVIATSLTKSFSGYADVMAGSLVLNRNLHLKNYNKLKWLFEKYYHNDLFEGDAKVLEFNSRDYLPRSAILNRNAEALTTFLHQQQSTNRTTSIKQVLYPPKSTTFNNFKAFQRTGTSDFLNPGYGCLFSVEFDNYDSTIAFYDAIQVHVSPHLGAHRTLALALNEGGCRQSPEFKALAEKYGWSGRQIRISVGLEDTQELINALEDALKRADHAKDKSATTVVTTVVAPVS
jgi:cystathionine gamma-synthase